MGLREDLAEKIYCGFWDKAGIPTEISVHLAATKGMNSGLPIDEAWISVSDECIRQMEWARKHNVVVMGARLVGGVKNHFPCPICGSSPTGTLTLAPDDWTPPKEG